LFLIDWQISLQCIGAIASGIMFLLWYRLQDADKRNFWSLYGWFTGFLCAGSIFGCIAECAQLAYARSVVEFSESESESNHLSSNYRPADALFWQAEASKWESVAEPPDALQMFLISVPLLMVLDRLMHMAFSTSGSLSSTWVMAKRVSVGIVFGLHTVSICCSAASSFYSSQEVPILLDLRAAFLANDTATRTALDDRFYRATLRTNYVQSVMLLSQASSFLFMIALFAVVFVVCFRRIKEVRRFAIQKHGTSMQPMQQMPNSYEPSARDGESIVIAVGSSSNRASTSHDAKKQKAFAQLLSFIKEVESQIVITVAVVFIMLVWIAICLLLDGITESATDICNSANQEFVAGAFCNPCENSYALIQDWLLLSPEFTVLSTYIPAQLALLVALWGMTSKAMFQSMKAQVQNSSAKL
jgi:hypothetical protein